MLRRKRKLAADIIFLLLLVLSEAKQAHFHTCFLFLFDILALSSAKVELILFEEQWLKAVQFPSKE